MPFLGQIMGESAVDLPTKELVVVRVSQLNGCRYCLAAHRPIALEAGVPAQHVEAACDGAPLDSLPARERAVVAWVDQVVRAAGRRHGGAARADTRARSRGPAHRADGARGDDHDVEPVLHRLRDPAAGPMKDAFATAVSEGRVGDRLWIYPTYHCNLACAYCLTESSPRIADRRTLSREALARAVEEAKTLGFGCVGFTGGEVFMLPWFADALVELSHVLPTLTLTNATLFTDGLLRRLEPLADVDAALQVSLDSYDPARNDEYRGDGNFEDVLRAIPRLIDRGIRVRIATTVESQTSDELERLCELHRRLGISDDDHVVRSVVRRGRAVTEEMGVELGPTDALPELTITADGAFLNPFGPTVLNGRTDLDLLVSRQIAPLGAATERFLRIAADQPAGADVVRNIR